MCLGSSKLRVRKSHVSEDIATPYFKGDSVDFPFITRTKTFVTRHYFDPPAVGQLRLTG